MSDEKFDDITIPPLPEIEEPKKPKYYQKLFRTPGYYSVISKYADLGNKLIDYKNELDGIYDKLIEKKGKISNLKKDYRDNEYRNSIEEYQLEQKIDFLARKYGDIGKLEYTYIPKPQIRGEDGEINDFPEIPDIKTISPTLPVVSSKQVGFLRRFFSSSAREQEYIEEVENFKNNKRKLEDYEDTLGDIFSELNWEERFYGSPYVDLQLERKRKIFKEYEKKYRIDHEVPEGMPVEAAMAEELFLRSLEDAEFLMSNAASSIEKNKTIKNDNSIKYITDNISLARAKLLRSNSCVVKHFAT